MEKPVLSPNFTIEDIHKLREYNYEMTKDMTDKERMDYYNKRGREVQRKLDQMKAAKIQTIMKNTDKQTIKRQIAVASINVEENKKESAA